MQNGKLYSSIIENDKLIWYLDNTTVYKTSDIAELVLIKGETTNLDLPISGEIMVNSRMVKPISISRTEKIEVGDWFLADTVFNQYIVKCTSVDESFINGNFYCSLCFKILALPEHFSPQQLQDIVDGKLKDGDKVLIECEIDEKQEFKIKLNPHITIYPVKEKMYTMEECKKLCIKAYKDGQNNWDSYYGRADQIINNEWFEQNVK